MKTVANTRIEPIDLYLQTSNLNKEGLIDFFGTNQVNVFHLYRDYNANTRAEKREICDIINEWGIKGFCKIVDHAGLFHLDF